MLEATSSKIRPDFRKWEAWSKSNKDITLIMMRPGGVLEAAYNINNADASISYNLGNNGLFIIDNDLVFGARTHGYKSIYQNVTYNITAPLPEQMDTHLFKYNPRGDSKDCFYNAEMNQQEIRDAVGASY